MNLRHFNAFVALGTELHFTRAAERLCLTQPALSALIRQLETSLGVALVQRHTRQVTLTEAGEQFYLVAQNLVQQFDTAIEDIQQYATLRRGKVSIAALPSVCGYFLPPILRQFRENFPDIEVDVSDASGHEIVDALLKKQVDLGVSYTPTAPSLVSTPLFEDSLVVAMHRDHPWAKRESIRWHDLIKTPLIAMAQGTTIRTLIDATALTKNIRLDIVLTPRLITTALAYVEEGLGVTILPSLGSNMYKSRQLVTLPLEAPVVKREISLIHHRDKGLSKAANVISQRLKTQSVNTMV